jgi:hypothetical protein
MQSIRLMQLFYRHQLPDVIYFQNFKLLQRYFQVEPLNNHASPLHKAHTYHSQTKASQST